MNYRRLFLFPALLVVLTLILAFTIVTVDRGRDAGVVFPQGGASVSSGEYREALRDRLQSVWSVVASGSGDAAHIVAIRAEVLAMRVPGADRDAHIQVVALLNALEEGMNGDADAWATAQVRAAAIDQVYEWIR